jgi:hypothetical protein
LLGQVASRCSNIGSSRILAHCAAR